jgi:hypothetical protein
VAVIWAADYELEGGKGREEVVVAEMDAARGSSVYEDLGHGDGELGRV